MAIGDITQARLRELLDYDPERGVFQWRSDRMCGRYGSTISARAGDVAGGESTVGYWRISVDNVRHQAHKLAILYVHGEYPRQVDHIDGNRLNNRIANLRAADFALNAQNRRGPNQSSKTGLLGVTVMRNKFQAKIMADGKRVHIGTFDTAQAAHEAYLAKKRELHGGCTL